MMFYFLYKISFWLTFLSVFLSFFPSNYPLISSQSHSSYFLETLLLSLFSALCTLTSPFFNRIVECFSSGENKKRNSNSWEFANLSKRKSKLNFFCSILNSVHIIWCICMCVCHVGFDISLAIFHSILSTGPCGYHFLSYLPSFTYSSLYSSLPSSYLPLPCSQLQLFPLK